MMIASKAIDDYKKNYENDIGELIRKNFEKKKEEIINCKKVEFLIKTARFIDDDHRLNMNHIRLFLSTPIWELEQDYEWVHKYITRVRFCNEFMQFMEYYKSRYEQTVASRKIQFNEICREYLQISRFNEVIDDYQLDREVMINSREEFAKAVKIVGDELKMINDVLSRLLSYDMMSDKIKNRIKKSYGIEVCPYCNRQFISWWEESGTDRITSDLDHVLPKRLFPLFSLNLYNLIPVCLVCNRYIKGNRYMSIWDPFKEGFDDMTRFVINKYKNAEAYIGLNIDFEIKLQPNKDLALQQADQINKTIWFFKFNELYNNHKEHVRTLIRKKYIYTPEVVQELNQLFGTQHISQKEIELLLYGVIKEDDDWNKEVLGKLTYDILWGDI